MEGILAAPTILERLDERHQKLIICLEVEDEQMPGGNRYSKRELRRGI